MCIVRAAQRAAGGTLLNIKVKNLKEEVIKDNTKQIILTLEQDGVETDIVFEGNGSARVLVTAG
ncbi:hypothetical protein tpqmel_0206 [Candidatus Gastranaerophilus sp. (ex Termes propinquus)]|nr:hypothetical protein tpqmel_0206 [Candidatus Gastranaerophilus sp. (ex Termes propinquus)]